uniref:MalT-like TPR region domain-containing protein n=1 Tax=Thermosporothrix sp. COM3 TaxID=2490863 RepID=A0A455SKJ5_9CHLR|nr:hypothetical protein KTC_29970 [Thermosporothrix sp. COM3]
MLSEDGWPEDMVFAAEKLHAYLSILQSIVDISPQFRKQAATLISQIYQLQQRLSYHLQSIKQAREYSKKAVLYGKEGQDPTTLTMALRELASVYEWPQDIPSQKRRKLALLTAQEAVYTMSQPGVVVPALVRSWALIGLAKFQALNGQKQEVIRSVREAQEAFAQATPDEDMPGFHLDHANLVRQEAIARAYTGAQNEALALFAQLIDIESEHAPMREKMSPRTHMGLLSEATFASLKLPSQQKDKELSIRLWQAELEIAKKLKSETYLNEAYIAYRVMESLWPDDPIICDLRDMLV